ncbi:hypothetical protein K2173_023491 [Erythroxylum novogranatense]|uniref:C2H2-type domain-containing protein n=1 Tax=Erythroxylum novogranatense TaxID=1862640 RepID=A0AAV8TX98_9ROSI|nr:hypothetical protein K2173_023491 [Erythroxylum novogranatense]
MSSPNKSSEAKFSDGLETSPKNDELNENVVPSHETVHVPVDEIEGSKADPSPGHDAEGSSVKAEQEIGISDVITDPHHDHDEIEGSPVSTKPTAQEIGSSSDDHPKPSNPEFEGSPFTDMIKGSPPATEKPTLEIEGSSGMVSPGAEKGKTHAEEGSSEKRPENSSKGKEISSSDAGEEITLGESDDPTLPSDLVCPVCSKTFSSRRGVYGHLRAHPERTKRGLAGLPPPVRSPATPKPISVLDRQRKILAKQLAPTLLHLGQAALERLSQAQASEEGPVRLGSLPSGKTVQDFDINCTPPSEEDEDPSDPPTSPPARVDRGFDLNLPPPPENDEEDYDTGDGDN